MLWRTLSAFGHAAFIVCRFVVQAPKWQDSDRRMPPYCIKAVIIPIFKKHANRFSGIRNAVETLTQTPYEPTIVYEIGTNDENRGTKGDE